MISYEDQASYILTEIERVGLQSPRRIYRQVELLYYLTKTMAQIERLEEELHPPIYVCMSPGCRYPFHNTQADLDQHVAAYKHDHDKGRTFEFNDFTFPLASERPTGGGDIPPPEPRKVQCACSKCTAMIWITDFTYPYCDKCYDNLDGKCT